MPDFTVFAVCIHLVFHDRTRTETVLYPRKMRMRRYLNSFRGEPDIT